MRRFIPALAFVLLSSSLARAQSDSAARAQTLFDQAVTASRAGDYATACPKFAASQKLDPKTSTLLNLASCYELNGQTASAWATFKEAEAAARKYGRTDWAERAALATRTLEPKLLRLTIHVPEVVRAPRLRVELDGTLLQQTEWDLPLPVDPGQHRLDWSAPDFTAATRTIDVVTPNVDVTLTQLERAPRPISTALPLGLTPAPITVRSSFWTTGRVVGVVVGGLGVATLVAGSVFGLSASSKYDEAERLCGVRTGSPRECLAERSNEALNARDDADNRATVSTALFFAGGVLVASGAVLFVLSPPRRDQKVAIVPAPNGFVAIGRW